MLNNRGVCVYVAMLLSAVFLILPVYTQASGRVSVYADDYVQFLLPAELKGEPVSENPFQICLTDIDGDRIYFVVSKKRNVNADKDIISGEGTMAVAENVITGDDTLLVSDYGSKLLGPHSKKINWIRLQRQQSLNDYLMIYFWNNMEKQYLFLLEGPQIKMDAMIKLVEENIILGK